MPYHRRLATLFVAVLLLCGLSACTATGSGGGASASGGNGSGVTVFGDVDAAVTRNR